MTPDKLIPLSRLSKAEEHRDQVLFAQLIGEIRRTQREDIELLVLEELILRNPETWTDENKAFVTEFMSRLRYRPLNGEEHPLPQPGVLSYEDIFFFYKLLKKPIIKNEELQYKRADGSSVVIVDETSTLGRSSLISMSVDGDSYEPSVDLESTDRFLDTLIQRTRFLEREVARELLDNRIHVGNNWYFSEYQGSSFSFYIQNDIFHFIRSAGYINGHYGNRWTGLGDGLCLDGSLELADCFLENICIIGDAGIAGLKTVIGDIGVLFFFHQASNTFHLVTINEPKGDLRLSFNASKYNDSDGVIIDGILRGLITHEKYLRLMKQKLENPKELLEPKEDLALIAISHFGKEWFKTQMEH